MGTGSEVPHKAAADSVIGPPAAADWKDFLLEHKWIPSAQLVSRFGIARYDVDNFWRKPAVREVLDPWRISLGQSPERMRAILSEAWEYYLVEIEGLDVQGAPRSWVPQLLALKNLSRAGQGFAFLVDSRYLRLTCPSEFAAYRERGFTNVALAVHEFWPGKRLLSQAGVLPFMFLQTHSAALQHIDPVSMVEHVYLHYLANDDALDSPEALLRAKERLYVRHDETGLVTQAQLSRYGVPYNFCRQQGGLRAILRSLSAKYAIELGHSSADDQRWSAAEFRRRFPDRPLDTCEYCGRNLSSRMRRSPSAFSEHPPRSRAC